MKTIDVFVIGSLALGAAYVAKDYLTSECITVDTYVIHSSNGQIQHQEIKTARCYNDKKTSK